MNTACDDINLNKTELKKKLTLDKNTQVITIDEKLLNEFFNWLFKNYVRSVLLCN